MALKIWENNFYYYCFKKNFLVTSQTTTTTKQTFFFHDFSQTGFLAASLQGHAQDSFES